MAYHQRIELFQDNFIITKVENTGAFLGMGAYLHPIWKNIFLLVMPSIALLLLLGYLLLNERFSKEIILGLSFIVGGGIGNLFDRIVYGSVTDFLFIDLGFFRTGIFNMADVSVMVGTVIIIMQTLINKKFIVRK